MNADLERRILGMLAGEETEVDTTEPFLVCDFCLAPDPPWEYPAKTTMLPAGTESLGSWCACDACRELIDADKREELASRSRVKHKEMTGLSFPMSVIRQTQAQFWSNKTGPAREVKLTPIHGRWFER